MLMTERVIRMVSNFSGNSIEEAKKQEKTGRMQNQKETLVLEAETFRNQHVCCPDEGF